MYRISEVQFCIVFSVLPFLSITFLITAGLVSSPPFPFLHPSLPNFASAINFFLIMFGFFVIFLILFNFQYPLCLKFVLSCSCYLNFILLFIGVTVISCFVFVFCVCFLSSTVLCSSVIVLPVNCTHLVTK